MPQGAENTTQRNAANRFEQSGHARIAGEEHADQARRPCNPQFNSHSVLRGSRKRPHKAPSPMPSVPSASSLPRRVKSRVAVRATSARTSRRSGPTDCRSKLRPGCGTPGPASSTLSLLFDPLHPASRPKVRRLCARCDDFACALEKGGRGGPSAVELFACRPTALSFRPLTAHRDYVRRPPSESELDADLAVQPTQHTSPQQP